MERQAGGLIETIQLVVIGGIGAQICVALFYDHVARGAGAASSTGVFNVNAEINGDV